MAKPAEEWTLREILMMCAMSETFFLSQFEKENASLMVRNLSDFISRVSLRQNNELFKLEMRRRETENAANRKPEIATVALFSMPEE